MRLQAGKTAVVRVKAARKGSPLKDGTVYAEFWAPGKDPEHDTAVRKLPDYRLPCLFTRVGWVCEVPTAGWAPGAWTVRGHVVAATEKGTAVGWDWGVMELAA